VVVSPSDRFRDGSIESPHGCLKRAIGGALLFAGAPGQRRAVAGTGHYRVVEVNLSLTLAPL
jgi:hypothetical protein